MLAFVKYLVMIGVVSTPAAWTVDVRIRMLVAAKTDTVGPNTVVLVISRIMMEIIKYLGRTLKFLLILIYLNFPYYWLIEKL
jgi:hypothetical protein